MYGIASCGHAVRRQCWTTCVRVADVLVVLSGQRPARLEVVAARESFEPFSDVPATEKYDFRVILNDADVRIILP